MTTTRAHTPEDAEFLTRTVHEVSTALRDAADRLDAWPDTIAGIEPEAYLRNLLSVLADVHELTTTQRRSITLDAWDRHLITITNAARALGLSPAAVLRWTQALERERAAAAAAATPAPVKRKRTPRAKSTS